MRSQRKQIDCAIVGDAVGGDYSAFRLSVERPDMVIGVFDLAEGGGGRTCSRRLNGEGPSLDLGAFTISNRHNVFSLARHLAIALTPVRFRAGRHFLRGRMLDESSYADARSVPYRLRPEEQGKSPHALLLHALATIVPNLASLWPFSSGGANGDPAGAAKYIRAIAFRGRRLSDWGFWNLLAEVVSNEAYELLAATIGSAAAFRNANACDAIWTLLFEAQPGQQHYRFTDGFQQLPLALKRACGPNVAFWTSHKLTRLSTLRRGCRLHFDTPEGDVSIEAREVLLALPQRALQAIAFDEAFVDAQFYRDLEAVSAAPASKLFIKFATPWWASDAALSPGPGEIIVSQTDQPLSQCYIFDQPAADGSAVLLASYADDAATGFWSGLAPTHRHEHSGSAPIEDMAQALSASSPIIEAACAQLQAMHPDLALSAPLGGVFVDWSRAPYGGGWHSWAPHVRSWEVRERVRQPNPNIRVFICGEAFSQTPGWVEGALNNTEATLQRRFGLSRPPWVRSDHPLEF